MSGCVHAPPPVVVALVVVPGSGGPYEQSQTTVHEQSCSKLSRAHSQVVPSQQQIAPGASLPTALGLQLSIVSLSRVS